MILGWKPKWKQIKDIARPWSFFSGSRCPMARAAICRGDPLVESRFWPYRWEQFESRTPSRVITMEALSGQQGLLLSIYCG
jgi:hypothetical protein